jgi:hypothetical protein
MVEHEKEISKNSEELEQLKARLKSFEALDQVKKSCEHKVPFNLDEGQVKKKITNLEDQLAIEKEYNHTLKEKLRRLQKESIDSTMMQSSGPKYQVSSEHKSCQANIENPNGQQDTATLPELINRFADGMLCICTRMNDFYIYFIF